MLAAYVRVALDAEAVVRVRRLAVGVGAVVAFEDLAGTRMLPRKAAVLRETPRARALAGPGRRAALARLLGTDTFVRRGLAIARLGITVDEILAATRMRPVTPAFAGPARRADARVDGGLALRGARVIGAESVAAAGRGRLPRRGSPHRRHRGLGEFLLRLLGRRRRHRRLVPRTVNGTGHTGPVPLTVRGTRRTRARRVAFGMCCPNHASRAAVSAS